MSAAKEHQALPGPPGPNVSAPCRSPRRRVGWGGIGAVAQPRSVTKFYAGRRRAEADAVARQLLMGLLMESIETMDLAGLSLAQLEQLFDAVTARSVRIHFQVPAGLPTRGPPAAALTAWK